MTSGWYAKSYATISSTSHDMESTVRRESRNRIGEHRRDVLRREAGTHVEERLPARSVGVVGGEQHPLETVEVGAETQRVRSVRDGVDVEPRPQEVDHTRRVERP